LAVSATNSHVRNHRGRGELLRGIETARQDASNGRATDRQQAARWGTHGLTMLLVIVGLIGVIVWMVTAGVRDHVVVLKVDSLGNEIVVPSVPAQPLRPEESVIHGVLQGWVENVRWVSNDRRLFTLMWDKVGDFTTQAGLRQLQDFREEQDRRQQAGRRVQVTVNPPQPVQRSAHSWTITWREEAVDVQGQLLREESGIWTATLEIADFQGQVARQEMSLRRQKKNFRNLYGVFVDGITWRSRPLPVGKGE
jgi:type IV secretory pathway TrbF-like protein